MTIRQGLDARLVPVRDVFTTAGTSYVIPDYQRNYSWTADEIDRLLDDVLSARSATQEDTCAVGDAGYFLGNLVTTRHGGSKTTGTEAWEVVDGQQRLTTLFIILNTLRWAPEDHSSLADRLTYRSRRKATASLRHITRDSGDYIEPSAPEEHDLAILEGWRTVTNYLVRKKFDATARADLATYLLDHVTLVRAELPDGTDLNRYFEVMNTRGQQLNPVDIVKALLMRPLDPGTEMSTFDLIWNACSEMDAYVQMTLTRNDTSKRVELFGTTWSWLRDDLTFDGIAASLQGGTTRPSDGSHPAPGTQTSMSLDSALTTYAAVPEVELSEDPGSQRFRSTIPFPMLLLHTLRTFPAGRLREEPDGDAEPLEDKKLIEAFTARFQPGPRLHEEVRGFAVHLLRTRNLFDAYVVKRSYTSDHAEDGEWSLLMLEKSTSSEDKKTARYVPTFRMRAENPDDDVYDDRTRDVLRLQSMLRVTYTSSSAMHWITEVLRVVGETRPAAVSELVDVLRGLARTAARAAYFDRQLRPTGFSIERIVFTYLDYLLLQDNAAGALTSRYRSDFTFMFRSSIEHFHPQHRDVEQDVSTVSRQNRDLLGNLALITVSGNSKYSNNSPGTKAKEFTEIPSQSPKLRIMSDLTNAAGGRWDDLAALDHHHRVEKVLAIDCGIDMETMEWPEA
ncbi:GmrSD restriction endonuclease domain-containing protein [Brachybacterium tyrofermentans]|uniref:GmrSD restriction endonuclease domain-containing protein n=1 Tax=Brachybacterium tyrofermentans TaxID=47848 RepID=UPI003FD1168F